jgi:hypothetical protein
MSPKKEKPLPAISLRILGSRNTVARLVETLRQVIDITYTTPSYREDPPYEVRRYIGGSGLRMTDLASVIAEINATVKSYSRGNLDADEALKRVQEHLERYGGATPS